tara:strand:+ start:1070 stop:1318 length:249 start_codon:yes stop_codon:yes gene_type:complete
MNYIWYEPLTEALRHHIEKKHMNQPDALDELKFTIEHFEYSKFENGEIINIGCPWSLHCNCDWYVQGQLRFKMIPETLELKQ